MPHYKPLSDDEELLGRIVIGYQNAIGNEEFRHIFEKHGLGAVDSEKWYPAKAVTDVFNEIVETSPNRSMDFVSIGMRLADTVRYPPGFEQVPFKEALARTGEAQKLNTRGSDIGYIKVEYVSDNHAILRTRSVLPDNMLYGVNYAFARRFLPKGTRITEYFDETAPRHDDGAVETVFHLKWELPDQPSPAPQASTS